jgi:hypothetical protein
VKLASRCLSAAPAPLAPPESAPGGYVNRATRFGVATLGAVALPAPANDNPSGAETTPQIKWINVANEGEYLGHHQGGFKLDAKVMQQLVDNLHSSPQYALGSVDLDGTTVQAGAEDVVQFDYEHASEMAPWEGTIPVTGAPAIGWVRDLELRKDGQGRLQLWALAWLGDQIRGQIDRREYKWVSIAWNPAGVHWQSGKPIGAVLTSIAFTNHPFLQDLESLAAANRAAGQASRSGVQPRASSAEAHAPTPTAPSRERAVMELRVRLCTLYRLQPEANDDSIIRAAENASTTGGNLAAVLTALGVTDAAAAISAASEIPKARQTLMDALAQLDSLGQADVAADAMQEPQDVAAALSARGWARNGMVDPAMLSAVTARRKEHQVVEIAKLPDGKRQLVGEQRLARERGRQAFLAEYGVNSNPATQHLLSTFVAGPGMAGAGVQYAPPGMQPQPMQPVQLGGAGLGARPPMQLNAPPTTTPAMQPVNLANYSGNTTQRVIAHLSSVDQSFAGLEWGQKVKRAGQWRREYEAQYGAIAA